MQTPSPASRLNEDYRQHLRVIAVNWRGPYLRNNSAQLTKVGFCISRLEDATGRENRASNIAGSPSKASVTGQVRHKKLELVIDDFEIWIGWIRHPPLTKRADLE